MAETKYVYTISTAFKNGAIDPTKLKAEILASSISTTLSRIETNGGVCDIWFVATLTIGEKTALYGDASPPAAGSLVWEHDGFPEKVGVERLHLTLPKEVIGSATKAVVNDRPAVTFPTGQDSWGAVSISWPRAVDSNAELRLGICFVVAGSGSGAAVVLEGKIKAESEGDDSGADFSATDTDIAAVDHANPGDIFCAQIVLDVSTFEKGNSVALQIGRQGTDPSDVVDVSIHMLCLEGEIYL